MKKLGKLSINPEKVIKNEELVNLRGGYNTVCLTFEGFLPIIYGSDCTTDIEAMAECKDAYPNDSTAAAWCED